LEELVAGLLRPRLFPFGKLSKAKSAAQYRTFFVKNQVLLSFGYRYNVPYRLHATLKSLGVIDNEYLLFRRQSIKLALPLDPTPLFLVAQRVLPSDSNEKKLNPILLAYSCYGTSSERAF
jgi:hypothetical protein